MATALGGMREAQAYLATHHIRALFEAATVSLLLHQPDDPVPFIIDRLARYANSRRRADGSSDRLTPPTAEEMLAFKTVPDPAVVDMIVNGVLPAIDDAGPRARLASASADEDDDAPDAHAEDVASGSGVDAHVPAEDPLTRPPVHIDGATTWKAQWTLRSHFDSVRAVACDPYHPIVASASDDATVKLFWLGGSKSRAAEPAVTLRGHSGPVTDLAVDFSRNLLASCSVDGTARLWAVPSARLDAIDVYRDHRRMNSPTTVVLRGHDDAVWSIDLHYREPVVLTAAADATVRLWDATTGAQRHQFLVDAMPVKAQFGGPDRSSCVVVDRRGTVHSFDAETGQEISTVETVPGASADDYVSTQPNAMAVGHNSGGAAGAQVLLGYNDGRLRRVDLASGTLVAETVAHTEAVGAVALASGGEQVASGGADSSLRFWDVRADKCVCEMPAHRPKWEESILALAYHDRREVFVSAGADATLRTWVAN